MAGTVVTKHPLLVVVTVTTLTPAETEALAMLEMLGVVPDTVLAGALEATLGATLDVGAGALELGLLVSANRTIDLALETEEPVLVVLVLVVVVVVVVGAAGALALELATPSSGTFCPPTMFGRSPDSLPVARKLAERYAARLCGPDVLFWHQQRCL